MSTTTHAAAICSPSFKRPVRALPSPIATPGKRRGRLLVTGQRPSSREKSPRFGGGASASRRRLRQLVLRRQHGTRHRSPLSLGADRGVHLVALRLVVHRTQGTPQRTSLLSYARDAMCFDVDSEPPIPRISGAAVSHDDLVLESEDGNRFAAFRAVPEGDVSTGVVILPDVRGLYRFYEELALRFAERGHAAIAFDYFGRTAGVDKRPDDWDYMPLVQQLTQEQVQADVGACVARPARARLQRDLHRRLLLRRQRLVGGGGLGPRARRRRRLLRPAGPDDRARAAARGADPGPAGRGRPGDSATRTTSSSSRRCAPWARSTS